MDGREPRVRRDDEAADEHGDAAETPKNPQDGSAEAEAEDAPAGGGRRRPGGGRQGGGAKGRQSRPGRNRALRGRGDDADPSEDVEAEGDEAAPGTAVGPARPQRNQVARQGGAGTPARRNRQGGAAARREKPRPTIVIDLPSSDGARRARRRAMFRTAMVWFSFLVMVAAPAGVSIWYLWARASDQYASQVSFAVRSLDSTLPSPVMDLLGGASDSTAGDSEMLFEYLQSQPLVQVIDRKVDLEKIYNRPGADPVFRLGHDVPIEDLVWYWNQAVTVSYDSSSGIIYVEARAFDPDDARTIAQAVLEESERLINDLSTKARNDAVEFALVDLQEAEARVRDARRALQEFRMAERSVDVTQDIAQAMALIGELKGQRAALQADYDSRREMLGAESRR